MKKLLLLSSAFCLITFAALSQGCIPIRNLTGFNQFSVPVYGEEPAKWLVMVNTRYSEFNDTYSGSTNLDVPPPDQIFSRTFVVDLAVTRMFENGWSFNIDLPIMAANRRNWIEHDPTTKEKHTTRSFGVSDLRVTVYKWLLNIQEPHRGNIQLGLGIKLPTGDYRVQDYFYKPAGRTVMTVNPTLQLGDGGTGFTAEVNAFYTLAKSLNLYANLFYLFNPRDQNGTASNDPSPLASTVGSNVNSVPDAFSLRGGANYTVRNLVFWGGLRFEGSPVYDAFGASNGIRRAGYLVSVEPGINYNFKKATIFAFVPLPVYRTTKQIAPDKEKSAISGTYVPSPGGMPNALVFVGAVFKM